MERISWKNGEREMRQEIVSKMEWKRRNFKCNFYFIFFTFFKYLFTKKKSEELNELNELSSFFLLLLDDFVMMAGGECLEICFQCLFTHLAFGDFFWVGN